MDNLTPSAQQALNILRVPGPFQWSLVPILGLIVYAYCVEIGKKNWNVVIAGAAYYGIEWMGEVLNSLVLRFTGRAPLWGEPGPSAYLIMVGINVETTLMFLLFGLALGRVLPVDPKTRILGVPSRIFLTFAFALFCVCVESILNKVGALTWDWKLWGWPHIWTVVLGAYAPAIVFTIWVHDLKSRKHQLQALAGMYALDAVAIGVFGFGLGWI